MLSICKTLLIIFFISLSFQNLQAQKLILYTGNDSYVKVGQEKSYILARGEPAFANFFDLKVPSHYFLITPKGDKRKITLYRKTLYDPWFNTPRIAYEIKIKPEEKGDYLLCIEEEDTLTLEGKLQKSFAKTVIHVEREAVWDNFCGFPLEIKPLTRPYGLKRGSLFRGQILLEGKPLKEAELEIERLRLKLNLEELPKDSTGEINVPLVIKTIKTDERGYFYTNFEEEGWWVITARILKGVKMYGNKTYPFQLQAHFWIYVYP